jgi:predicted RNA-binding Zn-ribbon protein involved in translation (DUF1610 family)
MEILMWFRKGKKKVEKPKGKKSVKRCPQCGSSDIIYENALVTGYKYHCKRCDYIGALVLEEDYDVDEVLKEEEGEGK